MNEDTRKLVIEWITKAEADYSGAVSLSGDPAPHHDLICYLAQQCIEKLMKGLIIAHGGMPEKTHDLVLLNEALTKLEPGWSAATDDLRDLSWSAVHFRYPGYTATPRDERDAMRICNALRSQLITLLESLL